MELIERIQQAAQASGKSQAQIAGDSGLPQPTINRILNGKRPNPTWETLQKLRRALDFDIDDIGSAEARSA
jgi:transcriptional regulator with XRE-family HTH domain